MLLELSENTAILFDDKKYKITKKIRIKRSYLCNNLAGSQGGNQCPSPTDKGLKIFQGDTAEKKMLTYCMMSTHYSKKGHSREWTNMVDNKILLSREQ